MGLDVSKLTPSPSTLRQGVTRVVVSYYAVVDEAGDNPVSLKLYIEPLAKANFIGNDPKKVSSKKTISTTVPVLYTWEVDIEITETPASPMGCSLLLEATDAKGYRSKTKSFLIYY